MNRKVAAVSDFILNLVKKIHILEIIKRYLKKKFGYFIINYS